MKDGELRMKNGELRIGMSVSRYFDNWHTEVPMYRNTAVEKNQGRLLAGPGMSPIRKED
jgi:hypothetical protein